MDAELIARLNRARALTMDNPEAQDEIDAAILDIAALSATPQAAGAARGYVDDDRKRVVSSLQEMRDRLGGFLVSAYGDRFDGDIDTMLDALNLLKAVKIGPAAAQAAQVPDDTARLDFIERTFSGMTNRERYLPVKMIWGAGCNGRTLREACDKYMAQEPNT